MSNLLNTMKELKQKQMELAQAGIEAERESSLISFKGMILATKVNFDSILLDTDSSYLHITKQDLMSKKELDKATNTINGIKELLKDDDLNNFDLKKQLFDAESVLSDNVYVIQINRFNTPSDTIVSVKKAKKASNTVSNKQVEINGEWKPFKSWTAACEELDLTIKNQSGKTVLTSNNYKVREV